MGLAEKVRFEIAVSDEFVEPTIDALCDGARTGEVGDGKIFVLPLERAVRIRTGETDHGAVTPVGELIDDADLPSDRQDRHRRHRLDARRDRAGAADDARARALLRRPGALEEHPQHVHDVRRGDRGRGRHLGGGRLLVRLRRGQRAHRRLRLRVPQRRRLRAARGLDDPAPALLRLPGDLLHHHHRAGLGRGGRADALRRLPRLRRALVGARLRGARPLGLRPRLAARGRHARLRRRRRRSRWAPGSRPWPRRSSSARARTTGARRCCRTTPSTCCSAPACCGSAGSGSTAAAASTPAATRCSRSPTRC